MAMRAHPGIELQIVTSASFLAGRFGAAEAIFKEDGFDANWRINTILEADDASTAGKTTGLQLIELSSAFANLKPDIVVTIADRFETIATAVAAAYDNIPVAHVQGGEVTGNIDERVRHAVTKLSDLHLVANELAAERIRRMGEEESRIYNTGCPSIDIARSVYEDKEGLQAFRLFENVAGVGHPFDIEGPFLVMMQHPETTHYETARADITETLHAIVETGLPAVIFWPNADTGTEGTAEGIRAFREKYDVPNHYFLKNLPPDAFLRLLIKSRCFVGNSSVGVREASYLGVPVVNIGDRQSGRQMAENVITTREDRTEISAAISRHLENGHYRQALLYGNGDAGKRIADTLAACPIPSLNKKLTY